MPTFSVTFHTHFGATLFQKRARVRYPDLRLAPVPRTLSASCGVHATFEAENPAEAIAGFSALARDTDAIALYRRDGDVYKKLLSCE